MSRENPGTGEATVDDAIPRVHEVHAATDDRGTAMQALTSQVRQPPAQKSAAQWAYERMILYIQNFEKQLDSEHEVAMGFAGGDAGVLRIEGMGYFDPDIVTFYGSEANGTRTQLIQHVSQLNVMLRALPKPDPAAAPVRIGFRLAADLDRD
ncbi:MAG: DUF6173 family protein [Rhodobacteraceae bacterium]|nr:DUF6173 family protein [Paracoccaceae bacterium]